MSNFTLQDILGAALAFALYPLVFLIPGYVVSWVLDLFDFKHRLPATRFVIAIVVSMAISPILTFLTYELASAKLTFLVLAVFFIAFIGILVGTRSIPISTEPKQLRNLAIYLAAGWSVLSILSLIDIQWGDRLYYNVVSYDFTTRVAIVNAITRTGVPPINPSYFPGYPVKLTYVYYFWYIPCSLIDQIGGIWIDSRQAMIASVAWCGLGTMATIALYLRLRNPEGNAKAWKSALLGSSLLLVSGLDVIPALLMMIVTRLTSGTSFLDGDIELWNQQITAWIGAIQWVPHHVAAMIACIAGMLLLHSVFNKSRAQQVAAMIIAGLAFASAFGLSVYVTIVFAVFWGIWTIVLFFKKENALGSFMLLAGVVALIAISPFLVGLFQGVNSSSSSSFPFAFAVRSFYLVVLYSPLISYLPLPITNLIFLLLLPINYLMELGFFFFIGLLWIERQRGTWRKSPFYTSEVILLSVTVIMASFIRSTVIGSNDFGWRAWLFGQFILLVWSVDILNQLYPTGWRTGSATPPRTQKVGRQLMILLVIGLSTTIADVFLLRTWPLLVDANIAGFPNHMSSDTQLGKRTFAARQAYEYINENMPINAIIQPDPTDQLNRPAGLYLNRQMAISGHTAYGVSAPEYQARIDSIGGIFEEANWDEIDRSCKEYFIDAIVVTDLNPLWKNLTSLKQERRPLYQNAYYAVFACGKNQP